MGDSAARFNETARRLLGPHGRVLAYWGTEYMPVGRQRAVVFNSAVYVGCEKAWCGDLDLTEGEGELVRLAAETGQTVRLHYEDDDDADELRSPAPGHAAYSVTASGHTSVRASIYQRDRDGRMYLRAPIAVRRIAVPARPRVWPFWRLEVRLTQWGARVVDGYSTFAVILGRSLLDGSPHLVLTCAWFRHIAGGGWVEWSWYPSAMQRRWAPSIRYSARRLFGPVRPWASLELSPGERDELRLGVVIGESDPRWG